MNKILIHFAHPAITHSKINKALRKAVEDLEGVTINDLYATYPDFLIDVKREQHLCEEHDVIIFQHPFYWYSAPAILKEWQDLVLEYGWAFGPEARGLKGKLFLQAISAGGDEKAYNKEGVNHYSIAELTSPYQAMANLCKMHWLPPFTIFGIHRGISEEKVNAYAEEYRRVIIALRDGTLDIEQAEQTPYINSNLHTIIKRP